MFALLMEPFATVKHWYCYNRIELWLRFSSEAISLCSAEPLAFRGTLGFRGIPVEKH